MIGRIGSLMTSVCSPRFWRAKRAAWLARAFDRRHGTDTVEQVPVSDMRGIDAGLAAHAVHYEASSIPKVNRGLAVLRRTLGAALPGFNFVDFGSGKGLVVMLASLQRFRHVSGVELSPRLHEVALRNLGRFASRHPHASPMSLSCGDALAFELPEGDLVAYLYNPFDAALLERLVTRLDAHGARGDEVVVLYVNPVHEQVFSRSPRFRRLYHDGRLSVFRWRPDDAGARA